MDTKFHKACISSWDRLKNYFIKLGFDCDIKIFTYDSPEVQEFKKEYNYANNYEGKNPALLADAFRMWVLSRNTNYLWLDSDIYIHRDIDKLNLDFPFDGHLGKSFCVIFNGQNTEKFKYIWNIYQTTDLSSMGDKEFIKTFLDGKCDDRSWMVDKILHLCEIDRQNQSPRAKWHFVSNEDTSLYLKERLNKREYTFISLYDKV